MELFINGEVRSVPEGLTVLGVLEHLAIDPARVALEIDGCIVKRQAWADHHLFTGARLEIVQFVGGG